MASWADIQRGIFAGESGGDYDALYGFRNRSGPFQGTRVSQMPIADVLAFTDPSGPYAQSVKSEIGRVATPVGAYQVVGSTLRDAVNALGLDPSQTFDRATQDKIGQWILANQGTGAWEGYKGPRMSTSNSPQSIADDAMSALGMRGREMPQQQPMGLLEQLGIQKMGSGGPQGNLPFYQRDRFKDTAGALALALNDMQLRPGQGVVQNVAAGRQRRDANRTAQWLAQQPGGAEFAQMLEAGADPAQVLMAYRQARQPSETFRQVTGAQIGLQGEDASKMFNVGPDGKVTAIGGSGTTVNVGGDGTPGWEAVDKAYADTYLKETASGLADAGAQAAQIGKVLSQLEAGEQLTGPALGVLGDLGRALLAPDAQQAKEQVESVVQRSLRETLGAQFTAAEGERLIARAYNINLSPEQNAARLRALYTQLASVAEQKKAMRDYFNQNGTLRGFDGGIGIPSADDFIAAMDAAVPAPVITSPASRPSVIRYDSEGNRIE